VCSSDLDDLYAEVDNILRRNPDLKIIFAHFYFLSVDLERAARFLDAHPAIRFDLAPHIDMYRDFSREPDAARAFFFRFQNRIIYGTDTDTRVLDRGPDGFRSIQSIPVLIRSFLERDGEFNMPDGIRYHGLGLPREVLEKIYTINFEQMYGAAPMPLKPTTMKQRM
jgi:predicted TIM-barrel fold metal-dependent hydrolase